MKKKKKHKTLINFWGNGWKILGIEGDVVYMECIYSLLNDKEMIGETDVVLISDVEE